MAETVKIKIEVDGKDAETSLNRAGKVGQDAAKKVEIGFNQTTSALKTMQGVLGAQVLLNAFNRLKTVAVNAFGTIIDSASQMQDLTTQFQVLTGSIDDAKAIMADLKSFSASTPFQMPDIAKSAAQLKAFGFANSSLIPILQNVGDVAAASGGDLGGLATIFGQVSAAGKLTGERLRQLQERGIPILSSLATTLGVAESSVNSLVSEGKIKFADFEKAMISMSSKGGFAFKGMEEKSKTFNGAMSTLRDNISIAASDFGSHFIPVLSDMAVNFTDLIKKNKDWINSLGASAAKTFDSVIQGLSKDLELLTLIIDGNFKAAGDLFDRTMLLTSEFGKWSISIISATLAIAAFLKTVSAATVAGVTFGAVLKGVLLSMGILTIKFTAIVAAIAVAAYGMKTLTDYLLENSDAAKQVREEIEKSNAAYSKQSNELFYYRSEMQKNSDVMLAQLGLLEQFTNYDAETIKEIKIEADVPYQKGPYAGPSINAERERQENEKLQAVQAERDKLRKQEEALHAEHLKNMQDLDLQFKLAKTEADYNAFDERAERVYSEKEWDKANAEERQAMMLEQINYEQELKRKAIQDTITDKIKQEQELRKLDIETQKQRLANQKSANAQLRAMQQSGYESAIDAAFDLSNTMLQVAGTTAKEQFYIQKALAIAQATVAAYTASSLALANPPGPPWTIPVSAAAFSKGMINVGLIAATGFVQGAFGKFAKGGIVGGNSFSGDKVPIYANSREMVLNDQQQAELFNMANGGSNNSELITAINRLADRPVVLVADDKEIARAASRGFGDGIAIAGSY